MSKAADSGQELNLAFLEEVWSQIPHTDVTEIVLIAPNKKVYKQWEKAYPGIKIVLKSDHRGYPFPKISEL